MDLQTLLKMLQIPNSLKSSFNLINKNRHKFIYIFLLQAVFFIIVGLLLIKNVVPIAELTTEISDYASTIALDDISVATNIMSNQSLLGNDPDLISRNLEKIKNLVTIFLIQFFLIFIIINGSLWYLTKSLNKKLNYFKYLLKFLTITIFYTIIIYLLVMPNITFLIENTKFEDSIAAIIFFIILQYLFFIFLASDKPIKQTFTLAFKKVHIITLAYLITLTLTILSMLAISFSVEKNFAITTLITIFYIFLFTWKRLFFINVIESL